MTRVIPPQMTLLLDLLSEDGVLENGNVNYANITRQNFWKRIAVQLNSVEGGVCKNAYKWCKMWADWKNKTKKKADILFKKKSYEFNPQTPILTTLELRLLKIIGYPLTDNATLLCSIEMTGKIEPPDNTTDVSVDYLAEDLMDDKVESEEEDNKALRHFARKKRKYKRSRSVIDEDKSDAFDDSMNSEKKVKYEVRSKESFEEFKTRTKLELEKERAQQKSEELRLKALELKLKGDELRLKEIEMNKVNYLTSIEEEKLKCFRDISSSLKELLERCRNGSARFQM
ncbi:uncharacterized protein [Epargyreus clarus]|uniref:uncharacterized protein n=1 Tax=Epargyreus clarus TaxID=520877 RepID=UPI003C2EAF80